MRRIPRCKIVYAVFSLMLIYAGNAQSSPANVHCVVGYITGFKPNAEALVVMRAGASSTEPAGLWTALCPGDVVTLADLSQEASATLELWTGREELNSKNQKFMVPQVQIADALRLYLSRLAKAIQFWAPPPYSNDNPNLITRAPEDSIEAPILSGLDPKLTAGSRIIALSWAGGRAPFTLTINRENSRIFNKLLEQNALPPSKVELSIGSYDLTLTDADGKQTTYHIQIQDNIPQVPEHLITQSMSVGFAALLKAGWLSTVDDGAWRWQALLELLPYIRENPSAEALASALLNGDQL